MTKIEYEQILETAWARALSYAARNALTEYFNGRIAIERSDYKKERLLSFPTTEKSCLFSKKSRPTQIKYIRFMHKIGAFKPYFPDADTHISFFNIDTTEILEFIQNYWLQKGIPFNDFEINKVKTTKKPENFSDLINQLEGLLFNKFPIPAEILNKLNPQGENK